MKLHTKKIIISLLLVFPLSGYALDDQTTLQPSQKEIKKEKKEKLFLKNDQEVVEVQEETTEASPSDEMQDFTLCSQQAIEERDTRIAASRTLYNQAMNNALQERKRNEKLAVAIKQDDEKKSAIKKSVESYKTLAKSAQSSLTSARKEAWKNFEDNLEACRTLQNPKDKQADEDVQGGETNTLKEDTIKDTILNTIKSLFN